MRKARGFTLLEMLVALAVFAILGALAWGSLDVLASQQRKLENRAQAWQQLVLARQMLEQDIRHARIRNVRGPSGSRLPAIQLRDGLFQWTRGGVWNNQAEPNHLQRVFWQFDGDHPQRFYWPVADATAGTPELVALEVDAVDEMRVWLLDEQGRWLSRWPVSGQPDDAFPRAIRVLWHSPRFGEMQWQWHWGLNQPGWPPASTPGTGEEGADAP